MLCNRKRLQKTIDLRRKIYLNPEYKKKELSRARQLSVLGDSKLCRTPPATNLPPLDLHSFSAVSQRVDFFGTLKSPIGGYFLLD